MGCTAVGAGKYVAGQAAFRVISTGPVSPKDITAEAVLQRWELVWLGCSKTVMIGFVYGGTDY